MRTKTIKITGVGRNGNAKLHNVTTNLKEALENTDLIMPVLPAYALEEFAKNISPHLKPGHKICLTPGSTGGSLLVAKTLNKMGKSDGIMISEMHTLPYACRKTSSTSVKVLLECKKLYFAAFPSIYNEPMYELVKELYPSIELMQDVLETSLNNGNPVSHPAPVVLNAGKIESSKDEHYHYRDGITPSVARVVERVDEERQSLCRKLGYKVIDVKDRLHSMGYAPKRETLYKCYQDSKAFNPLKGPNDLNSRYLVEDTPCSLVALSSLGKSLDIGTPVMDSVITLAATLKDEDYWKTGYNLSSLGLEGMTVGEMKSFLRTGYTFKVIDNKREAS